ncbi:MAG: hypothetical protein LBS92_04265 [Candidatus Methanoplasma sp.]|nr:hypothetical protein [Candidatus Methanoplasma sp.]
MKTHKINRTAFMNEAPTVVGMMSVVIEGGGSLDTAVRDVALNGPAQSSAIFREMVSKVDTRAALDIKTELTDRLSALPSGLAPFRRSMHMIAAASESVDCAEKKRMLGDASDMSVNGLKEAGEAYSSSLNTPCMVIFGLGIMIPMVMMSILPMMNIGGMFGSSAIGAGPITLITLVVVPCVMLGVILSIRNRNPFSYPSDIQGRGYLVMIAAAPVAAAIWCFTGDAPLSVSASAGVAGLAAFVAMFPSANAERRRRMQEHLLNDAVFETGNRLVAGESFEAAVTAAVGMRKECLSLADSVTREMSLCRGDVCSALAASIGKASPRVAEVFCDIYRSSLRNVRDAGRLAISVGRQLQDQESARKGIQNKLKSMTDMMTGTSAVFAPLVLGMSVSMLAPISKIMEGADAVGTSSILAAYLVELCVLMAVLTSSLGGCPGIRETAYRASMMLPASSVVFFLCSNISL